MRAFRELAGWALFLVVVATPFVALAALITWIAEGIPTALGLSVDLLVLAWGPLLLAALRLREPPPEDVAEADGRPPVLLLHRFTRVSEPWWKRSLMILPTFYRDLADARLERRLVRRANAVGPVIPLARPDPASDGSALDREWLRQLGLALPGAALVMVVLDGSRENAFEIERVREVCGFHRLILVPPMRRDRSFSERYEAMRGELAFLPPLHPRTGALRFYIDGTPSPLWSMAFGDDEKRPAPKAPMKSWLLVLIPLFFALLSAITAPGILRAPLAHISGDDAVAVGIFVLVMGIVLATMARRAVRLVPTNEAVMVTVAASPWLLALIISRLDGEDLGGQLRAAAIGATYAAPLLLSTSLVLAASSLIRRAQERSATYFVFGAVALLPFAPLALSIADVGPSIEPLMYTLAAASFALGLAAWSASGEPGRPHAPLPIGAAVAAALTVAAWAVIVSSAACGRRVGALQYGDVLSAIAAVRDLDPLFRFVQAWPWFAVIAPAVVVLVASRFARRVTPTGIGNLAAFVPLMIACALSTGSQAQAREQLLEGAASYAPLDPSTVPGVAPGFELPAADGYTGARPPHLIVDFGGVIIHERSVTAIGELARPDFEGGRFFALEHAIAQLRASPLRIAARSDLDFLIVRNVLAAAAQAGSGWFALLTRRSDGSEGYVEITMRTQPPQRDLIRVFIHVQNAMVVLEATDGTHIEIPRIGTAIDLAALDERLRDRRQQDPNRHDIELWVDNGVRVSDAVAAASAAQNEGFGVTLAEPPF